MVNITFVCFRLKHTTCPATSLHMSNVSTPQAAVAESPKPFGSPAPTSPLDHTSKQLDFGVVKPEPKTPGTPFVSSSDEVIDYNQFIKDTLLWTNKVRSSIYLVGGLISIFLMNKALHSKTTIITGMDSIQVYAGA